MSMTTTKGRCALSHFEKMETTTVGWPLRCPCGGDYCAYRDYRGYYDPDDWGLPSRADLLFVAAGAGGGAIVQTWEAPPGAHPKRCSRSVWTRALRRGHRRRSSGRRRRRLRPTPAGASSTRPPCAKPPPLLLQQRDRRVPVVQLPPQQVFR